MKADIPAIAFLILSFFARAIHGYKDGVYYIDLNTIRQELASAGKFPATSELPSPYLSDFFGLQRVRNVPAAEIKRDFVPRFAEISSEAPVLRLLFSRGYRVSFFLSCALEIDGNRGDPQSFLECSDFGAVFKDKYGALDDFLELLESLGLQDKYLLPNPYYAYEQTAAADLKSDSRPRPTGWPQLSVGQRASEKAAAIENFERSRQGVLIFGDTHGDEASYGNAWEYITRPRERAAFDWIGLEMLPVDMQPALDSFIAGGAASPEYKEAEDRLLNYFRKAWANRFGKLEEPAENHYFRIVRWAREHGVNVYALDAVGEYTLYRYGEFPLGATVRNIVWAQTIPLVGKGVIYGGSAHFVPLPATPFTFQDYVRKRDPKIQLFLVR